MKYYKIKYTLNILPSVTYVDDACSGVNDLLEALGDTDEQEIFDTRIVKDFYEYQWQNYAKHVHYFGAGIHLIYCLVFLTYVNQIYLYRNFSSRVALCWTMLVCLIYPSQYEIL